MGSLRLLLLNRSVHGIKQAMGFSAGQTDGPDGAERERKICDQSNDMNNPSGFDIVVSYSGRRRKDMPASKQFYSAQSSAGSEKATHAIKLRFSSRRSNNPGRCQGSTQMGHCNTSHGNLLLSKSHVDASPTFFYASLAFWTRRFSFYHQPFRH